MLQDEQEQTQYPPKQSPKYFRDKISFDDIIDDENSNLVNLDHKIPLTKRITKRKDTFFNLEMKKIVKQDQTESNSEKLSNELKKLMNSCGMRFCQNYTCRDFNQQKTKSKKLTPFQVILKENEAFKEIVKFKIIKNNTPSNLHYIIKSDEIVYSSGNLGNKKNKFNLRNFISKKKYENKKSYSRKKNSKSGYIYKNENNIKQKIFNKNKINKISLFNILNENNNILKKGIIDKIKNDITKNNNNNNYLSDKGNINNSNSINNPSYYFLMKNYCNNYRLPFINKQDNFNNNNYNRNSNAIFSIEKKEYYKTSNNGFSFDKNIMKEINKYNIKNGFSSQKCQTVNFEDSNYTKSIKNLYLSKTKKNLNI